MLQERRGQTFKEIVDWISEEKTEALRPTIERFGGDERVLEKMAKYGNDLLENEENIAVRIFPWFFEFSKVNQSVRISVKGEKGQVLIPDVTKIEASKNEGHLAFTFYEGGDEDHSKFIVKLPEKNK
jgi:hypothetical protein